MCRAESWWDVDLPSSVTGAGSSYMWCLVDPQETEVRSAWQWEQPQEKLDSAKHEQEHTMSIWSDLAIRSARAGVGAWNVGRSGVTGCNKHVPPPADN